MARRLQLAAAVLAVAILATACGGGEPKAAAAEVKTLGPELVPGEIQGLRVAPEEVKNLKEVKRPFVEAVGLYSLRQGEQLQATLQISRFTKASDADKTSFRTAVIQQIGSTVPKSFRMGRQTIFLTTGRRQSVAIWFKGRTLFILSAREEYPRPRALLRDVLEIKP